jgi:hypothetical protein
MFAAFDQLGTTICSAGWFQSLLGDNFADGIAVLFGGIADGGGAAPTGAAQEEVWSALGARYYLDDATAEQLARLRKTTDNDVRRAVAGLVTLGALAEEEAAAGMLRLTPLTEWALRSRYGAVALGDQIAQLKVTLLDTEPPVWRRLLVPATIRLDRLDRVIQAAMGWTNSHLHMFIHPSGRYGVPDLDFPLHDERRATLRDLVDREGETVRYEYDFGDGWEHEIALEQLLAAEPGGRHPTCLAGARACPPEDSEVSTATPISSTHLPTPPTPNISTCWNGSASKKAATSTRRTSTPPTPTADSTPSYSPRPAPPDQGSAAGVGRARGRNSVGPAVDTAQSETPRGRGWR